MPDEKLNPAANPSVDTLNPALAPEASSEILELLPKESIVTGPISGNPNQHAQGSAAAPPASFPELPGLGSKWLPTTDPKVLDKKHPLFLEHTKLLSTGTPVENIEHPSKYAIWAKGNGCQCPKCKTSRNELRREYPSESGGENIIANTPKAIGKQIKGRLLAELLNLPAESMHTFAKVKKYPIEAQEVWKTSPERLAIYKEYSEYFADRYLHLINSPHEDLIEFAIWYVAGLGFTLTSMNMMLDKKEKKQ